MGTRRGPTRHGDRLTWPTAPHNPFAHLERPNVVVVALLELLPLVPLGHLGTPVHLGCAVLDAVPSTRGMKKGNGGVARRASQQWQTRSRHQNQFKTTRCDAYLVLQWRQSWPMRSVAFLHFLCGHRLELATLRCDGEISGNRSIVCVCGLWLLCSPPSFVHVFDGRPRCCRAVCIPR